jgi:hypothetical protein
MAAPKAPTKKSRGFLRYDAYNFRTKDPQIDELRTLLQRQNGGRLDGSLFRQVHDGGGPTASCLRGWFFGKTRSPWNASLEAAGRAMGFRRKWVRWSGEEE